MKIDIIQFLKKLNLASRLAQSDCLFVVEGLKSFSGVSKIAKLWLVKNTLEPAQKIVAFLRKENNPFLTQIFNEAAAQPRISGANFYFLPQEEDKVYENKGVLKTAAYKVEWEELRDVCQEIVNQDFPELSVDFKALFPVMELKSDMRFYGVEFERLAEYTSLCSEACPLAIDWGLTDKPSLYLDPIQPLTITSNLSSSAQQNLAAVYTYLLFEKKCFPGNFSGVAVDEESRVNFAEFDYLYPFDNSLRRFLDDFIHNDAMPQNLAECHLRRSVETLRFFCPEVDLPSLFDTCFLRYPDDGVSEDGEENTTDGLMNIYEAQGMVVQPYSKIPDPDGKSLRHLLQKPQLGKEAMFRKSSLWYAGLLLILIYLSLKFF